MEEIVINHMISKIGWSGGDGVLTPGGTISNLYAVLLARFKFDPKVKSDGVNLHQFIIFTSKQASICDFTTSWATISLANNKC